MAQQVEIKFVIDLTDDAKDFLEQVRSIAEALNLPEVTVTTTRIGPDDYVIVK